MKLVMLTSELSKRFGDKKSLEYIKNAGFDGFDYSMWGNDADKIFITNDICLKSMLCEYGGNGFLHILNNIVPMLKDVGVLENDIETCWYLTALNFLINNFI